MADMAPKPDDVSAIDWLRPQSEQHAMVLQYLKDRIKHSEQAMKRFYPRWRQNELMLQAYVSIQDYDRMERATKDGRAPDIEDSPVAINVPVAWSTVNTIVTYLLHLFAGRRPIFSVGSYRSEQVVRARTMEQFLQYNADVVKFVRALYFFLMDGETYGVAVLRSMWKVEKKKRSVQVEPDPNVVAVAGALGRQAQAVTQQEEYVSFEGSSCSNVDPFSFFPDPRCPMHEVNEKGEWVVWRNYMGWHSLLTEQGQGRLKWVDAIDPKAGVQDGDRAEDNSFRGLRALGGTPTSAFDRASNVAPNIQVDQGTFKIVPADLGLGTSKVPEMWLFTILNKTQIVQAMPVEFPSGRHPVHVAEPNSVGYAFGQLGTVDMLGPMQKLMSWFMNSHIFNVRAALNNMFVVDPTKVELQDFKNPKPGKLIRLKNTAFGLNDPKNAVMQLQVSDVTRSHLADFQMFGRMIGDLSGAADNMRGLQDAGGRKTATEIRTAGDAGTSRLAAKGKIYSAMAFTSLSEDWALNAQNFLTQDFELSILGQPTEPNQSIRMNQSSIQGDFVFPVMDGTLPVDKLAMLDVWKEIFSAILADPQMRSQYDIFEMFDWIAQLGGAQNIKNFRLNMVPQTQQMQALGGQGPIAQQGVPMDIAVKALGGFQAANTGSGGYSDGGMG